MRSPYDPPKIDNRPDTATEWMDSALCREVDQDLYFPGKGGTTRHAKKICGQCPIATRTACLQWALDYDITDGIFGGLSPQERRRLRKAAA